MDLRAGRKERRVCPGVMHVRDRVHDWVHDRVHDWESPSGGCVRARAAGLTLHRIERPLYSFFDGFFVIGRPRVCLEIGIFIHLVVRYKYLHGGLNGVDCVEVDRELALWAVANERSHWKSGDIDMIRRDPSIVGRLVNGRGGVQAGLSGGTVIDRGLERALRTLNDMAVCGINAFTLTSPDYPKRLSSIPDPPLVLYSVGTVSVFDRCVAVSGTRKPSEWGLQMAERLGAALAREGWIVTSGLARGIDTAVHLGALSVPAGRTVAVSALPLDRVYPRENLELARRIIRRGALVSEHALKNDAGKVSFLRRNRIISGLSFAQFIVETSGTGGTRHQAEHALLQGRPLYVMEPPASEARASAGFQEMVRLGAKPCPDVETAVAIARNAGPHM